MLSTLSRTHSAVIGALVVAIALPGIAPPAGSAPAPGTAASRALVGRWRAVTTCRHIVTALERAGLRPLAPAVLAGNGLVQGSARQLARRRHICRGATGRVHSHFFNARDGFGSVDWNGRQVDDAPYRIVDAHTVRIGAGVPSGTFHFRIRGSRLTLSPVITSAAKRAALAHPLRFSSAGWMVAVAEAAPAWRRAPCGGWC